jgi:hypothetical protein
VTWFSAFVWTCAVETPIYVALLRRSFRTWWAPVLFSIVLQLSTHPLLWALFPRNGRYWTAFWLAEAAVVLAEGALAGLALWRRGDRRPFSRGGLASLTANASSAAVGLLISAG